jgi:hypothetical protein
MIKAIKEVIENLRYIFNAPILNITIGSGIILSFLSFLDFNGPKFIALRENPRWLMFLLGIVLVVGGILSLILTAEDRKINKNIDIRKGISLQFSQTKINIKVGKIQETSGLDKTCAVVLPANTTFIDDCITDKNSALGSFMMERYPDKISEIKQSIEDTLKTSHIIKDSNNNYPSGSTIIMPAPYDNPFHILLTAATVRKEKTGITAEPDTICDCIKEVFSITSDKKISRFQMPMLGSGHGGLEINLALLLLILTIKYFSNYYHHIKSIDIVIIENDAKRLKKDIYKLQYLSMLGR